MKVRYRYVNILKKTMKKTLITYLNPTYQQHYSPVPETSAENNFHYRWVGHYFVDMDGVV